jgi:hypothetical protein
MICAVRKAGADHQEGRPIAVMKANSVRKPMLLEPEKEGETAQVTMSNHDIARLLRKQKEVERYLEEIKRATASIEKLFAGEAPKRSYEIRYVADIDDYYM